MKKLLIGLILCTITLLGQKQSEPPPSASRLPFQSEIISFPSNDGEFSVYYTYRIPYKLLVFERSEELFIAGFSVTVEILDEDSKLVARDIKESRITVENFESTNDRNVFLQEYLSFRLKPGEYSVAAFISDKNSSGELPIPAYRLKLEETKSVLHPLVINSEELICGENKSFTLANSGGKIPYSSDRFHLIIPIRDTTVSSLKISIENNDDEIISTVVNESYIIPIGISECEKMITVSKNEENLPVKIFIYRNFNDKLLEGEVVLSVTNEENSIDEEFNSECLWFNKPFSLMDVERAIEYLSFIESDSIVYSMLDESSSDYPEILSEYWAKYDPTPETVFNEVMSEYYTRVDHAVKEFRGIGKDDGAKTDRGAVYIKFGQPEKIERSSNSMGQIVEIWTYSKPDRKISFIDRKGTGNFTLTEN